MIITPKINAIKSGLSKIFLIEILLLSPEIKSNQEMRTSFERNNVRYNDDDNGYVSNSGYSSSYAKSFLQGNKPKENNSVQYGKYQRGCKVRHLKFGEGTVIDIKGEGENLVVHVAFKGVGIKVLSAKYAPMEIV